MKEIQREASVPGRQQRPRRRRAGLVLLPAAIMAIAAGGFALLSPDELVSAGVGCHDAPSIDAGVTVVSATGQDPVAICAGLWEDGIVHEGTSSAPELRACVNEPGAVLVFPSDDDAICTDLGLQPLPDGYQREAKRFVAMRDAVVRELYQAGTGDAVPGSVAEKHACLDEATAVAVVSSVLDEHGFHAWKVEVATGDYQDRNCMNALAFEDAEKTVLVIPSEPGIDPAPFAPH